MQEVPFTLPTPDGKTIYGVRSGDVTKPAIVVVHGLTGNMYEHQFKHAARLWDTDFCVYRFNLYAGEEGGRNLIDCTLQTHADDFALVVADVAKRHNTIFAVGHSYGGPTLMLANCPELKAVSLWDPSYDLASVEESFAENYKPYDGVYTLNWGTTYLIGKAMRDHAVTLTAAKCAELSRQAQFPIQLILAGNGYYVNRGASYDTDCPHVHRRDVVQGTTHCFYEGDADTEVASLTADWFNQWL